ncbi:MAG: UxaA family hydrolase [Bryobacteraceae bacterium]
MANLKDMIVPASVDGAALRLHAADNVAIATMALPLGCLIRVGGRELRTQSAIPAGHKIAVADIGARSPVRRYGEVIGEARDGIRSGEHVHTHNMALQETSLSYDFPVSELPDPGPAAQAPTFPGHVREDGRVGTRNYVAIAATSNCAAPVVELIAESFQKAPMPPGVDGVAAFPHGEGCGHTIGADTLQLQRTIAGLLDHPNVAGAVLVGLGCEVNRLEQYFPAGKRQTEYLAGLTIQEAGGSSAAVRAGIAAIHRHIERASTMRRTEVSASGIVLGLNCGGSDSFSGLTANPALGVCSDLLARIGATVVLSETPETFGAEHLLVRRARNRAVAMELLAAIDGYKKYLLRFGRSFDDNLAPGNKEGGLTNIIEKSLGAVTKGGSSPLMSVVAYAERIASPGLVFMDTPGYDPVSVTGQAAGGANLVAFTTGRGSVLGFPTIPVVKIASNTSMFRRMRDNMDLNAGRILDGEASLEEVGREIFDLLLEVASGKRTASERLGRGQFVPWRIGPVL